MLLFSSVIGRFIVSLIFPKIDETFCKSYCILKFTSGCCSLESYSVIHYLITSVVKVWTLTSRTSASWLLTSNYSNFGNFHHLLSDHGITVVKLHRFYIKYSHELILSLQRCCANTIWPVAMWHGNLIHPLLQH